MAHASRLRRGAAVVDDPPVPHPDDSLGGIGDGLIMGHEKNRLAAGVEAGEQLEHLFATSGVECAASSPGKLTCAFGMLM